MEKTPVLSMPQAYDKWLVPRLFAPWGERLIAATRLKPDDHVLDVATGPGTIARLAATHVGARSHVVATDIAPFMLDLARGKPALPDAAPITYRLSPAMPLAVAEQSFDIAFCQQGLQFFPDRVGSLREMHRALRPGGQVAIGLWAEIARNSYFAVVQRILLAQGLRQAAQIIEAPFAWPQAERLYHSLEQAGFTQIEIVTETKPVVFEAGVGQALSAIEATPIHPVLQTLSPAHRAKLDDALAVEFEKLRAGNAVQALSTCHIATADLG
jgi:ubiquinone/menaquinone biosynthesis C-methylase UbiE